MRKGQSVSTRSIYIMPDSRAAARLTVSLIAKAGQCCRFNAMPRVWQPGRKHRQLSSRTRNPSLTSELHSLSMVCLDNSIVALVETHGHCSSPWVHIPVGYFKTMGNPNTDRCVMTEADPGSNGRAMKWPRGKTLGRSSSINGLLYVHGQAQNYDGWRRMGNPGCG